MPARIKNILFIMCDQLRWDYLSCYGHPTLKTPHIDGLAARGDAFYPRLCAVADLWAVAHELLHRALHAIARLELERHPTARWAS